MNLFGSHTAAALDPVILAKRVGMICDPWQADALRTEDERLALNIHRQGGKSTVAAVKALHRALYWPGSLVLIVSPTQRQSTELFRKVLTYYRAIGRPVNAEAENQLSLVLENGSRVIAVPGSEANIRGYSVDLLIIDEGSRVASEMWGAVSPMLAVTGGRAVTMSTPFGKRGWWYEAVMSKTWRTITVPATECPRISAQWLADERDSVGDFWFRQEYLCEFLDATGQMFSTDDINRIFELGRLGGLDDVPRFGDAIEARSDDGPADPPTLGAIERHRRQRRRANALSSAVQRRNCRHFYGPPLEGRRECIHCGKEAA